MKKTALLIATFLTLAAPIAAKPVDAADAGRVAVTFWNTYRYGVAKPVSSLSLRAFQGLEHLYVFANGDEGFVIVSADDCVQPVLAYSFDTPFPESLHPSLRYWLGGYEAQIAEAVQNDFVPSEAVGNQWKSLLSAPKSPQPLTIQNIPALVGTFWDQGAPYNDRCPMDSSRGERAVVGCVATAMAQIMKYWEYPAFGQGSHSYDPRSMWTSSSPYGTVSADFGNTSYFWNHMPSRVSQASLTYQRDAVAILSFHCGVSVNMMYGLSSEGGSGAYSRDVVTAMKTYFKYDPQLYQTYRGSSDSVWCALLDTELAAGRPMYYSGSDSTGGHAFVCDGSDLQSRYHFNWGWSGYGDGFYTLSNLAPGPNGGAGGNATYTFNRNQAAIVKIMPGVQEVFDTVDYQDSTCSNIATHRFREYTLNVANMDTLLRHLDTVFRYHLRVIEQKYIYLNPNGGTGDGWALNYCPAAGVLLPECTFSKENCRFLGWCRKRNGDSDTLQPGTHVMLNTNRNYYAIWQDTTVSIDDVHDDATLTLWPNPTTAEINISVPAHTGTILVIDALGRTILREDYPNIMGGTAKISLAALPNGAYNVQVKTDRGVYNQRVIKR